MRSALVALMAVAASSTLGLGAYSRRPPVPTGNAIHTCEGSGGRLFLASDPSECRPHETPLSWQRRGGLRVFDATGRDLGRLLPSHPNRLTVWSDGAGATFEVDWFTGEGPRIGSFVPPVSLFFEGAGCQGTPYVSTRRGDLPAGALLQDPRPPATQLWVVADRHVTELHTLSSFRDGACIEAPELLHEGEAAELEAVDLGFTFPVPVPVRFGADLPRDLEHREPIHACVGPLGRIRRVDAPTDCRRPEQAESWLRLGGARLYDAGGQEVGMLLDWSLSTAYVYAPSADVWFALDPLTGDLLSEQIRFTEPGCRGTAFANVGVGRLQPTRSVGGLPPHLVATGPLLHGAFYSSVLNSLGCTDTNQPQFITRGTLLAPFEGDLGFGLPLQPPLVAGFPGSPLADAQGDPPGLGVLRACVDPVGGLRSIAPGTPCLSTEASLDWERRGGLRLFDARGRDVGAHAVQEGIVDDTSGLRFLLDFRTGELDDAPILSGAVEIFYEEHGCGGRASRRGFGLIGRADTGLVLEAPPEASPSGYLVGSKRMFVDFVGRSFSTGTLCQEFISGTAHISLGVELDPFLTGLPFALPLPAPLRVGPTSP